MALLRRKVIIGPSFILNLRNLGHAESRGLTTFSHFHSHSMDTKNKYRNFLNGKPQVGFFMPPTSTLQSIRYTSTDRASKQDAECHPIENISLAKILGLEQPDPSWPKTGVIYPKWTPYWYNVKILGADLRIFFSLLVRILRGEYLSRKERRLLRHTTADIFRFLPGSLSVFVPLNKFLLPVYLKLFPNLLPTTFSYKINKKEAVNRKLKARLAYVGFLHDVAREMDYPQSGGIGTAEDYLLFIGNCIVGEPVSTKEILGFAKFFTDELTVDHISRPQLVNMCELLEISLRGNDDYLRLLLQENLKLLKEDDTLIRAKGIETLPEAELRKTCLKRGIYVAEEMCEEEMREQLRDWLYLSLDHFVPSSILVLSRAFTMTGKSKPDKVILATLSSLPHELVNIVGVTSFPFKDPVWGKSMKLESLCLQEKLIKEEREKVLLKKLRSDVAPAESINLSPERARAVGKQKPLSELSSHKLAVVAAALHMRSECEKFLTLVNKEIFLTEKEDIKAYRAAREESIHGDEVPSVLKKKLTKKVTAMFKNLDVDSKTADFWRLCDRCDGIVSLEIVAAAAYMKEEIEKLGVDGTTTHLRSRPRIFRSYSSQENGNGSFPPPIKSTLAMNIYLESGMDFQHWLIAVDKPDENLTRDEIIELYVSTLAKVVGSKEEARMMIYSVSTKYYFAFGVKISMEIANKLKELPGVTMVLADSYIDMKNKDYGGEPFVEGKAVPYDPKYHEVWETRQARMEKAAAELEAELASGVHKFEKVKISWWLMPQIWCKRAYLRWLRYKNKNDPFG